MILPSGEISSNLVTLVITFFSFYVVVVDLMVIEKGNRIAINMLIK